MHRPVKETHGICQDERTETDLPWMSPIMQVLQMRRDLKRESNVNNKQLLPGDYGYGEDGPAARRRSSSPGTPVDRRARPLTARRCDRHAGKGRNARHEEGSETVGEGGVGNQP